MGRVMNCWREGQRKPLEWPWELRLGPRQGAHQVRGLERVLIAPVSLPQREVYTRERFLALGAGILFIVKASEFSLSPPPFLEWKLRF